LSFLLCSFKKNGCESSWPFFFVRKKPDRYVGLLPQSAGLTFYMKNARGESGRISDHFRGLGTVTREMVERRAKEIAIINGRSSKDFTENDWLQAKHELMGDNVEIEEEEPVAALTRWDEEPGTSGHHVENAAPPDEQTVAEHLVEEGVEEANHDQMLKGSRAEENQT
jgi:hypothetical protein